MKNLLSLLLVASFASSAIAADPIAIEIVKSRSEGVHAQNRAALYAEIQVKKAVIYALEINEAINAELGLNNLNPKEIAIPAAVTLLAADAGIATASWVTLNKITPATSTKSWFTALETLERRQITAARALKYMQKKSTGTTHERRLINRLIVRNYNINAAIVAHKASKPVVRMVGRGVRHMGKATIVVAGLGVAGWLVGDTVVLQTPDNGAVFKANLENSIIQLEAAYESTISEQEITIVIKEEETAILNGEADPAPVTTEESVQTDAAILNQLEKDIEAALKDAQTENNVVPETEEAVTEVKEEVAPAIEEAQTEAEETATEAKEEVKSAIEEATQAVDEAQDAIENHIE